MAQAGDVEIRTATPEDAGGFIRAVEGAFGHVATEDDVAFWAAGMRWDRFVVAVDGGRVVAGAGADAMELTLPGPPGSQLASEPVAAVTAVGVSPTHRRRGIQRRLMARLHADARRRGEAIAALTASESLIYRRYGYGLAASCLDVALATDHGAFLDPPATSGRFRLVEADEAGKVLPALHEQCRRGRPGDVSRPGDWWDRYFRDRAEDRAGGSARFYAVHESATGEPDGYTSYRVHRQPGQDDPGGLVVRTTDVYALDAAVEAALWRFVLDLDLVEEIVIERLPVDAALRWHLVDPRRLRSQALTDLLWIRLLDVPRALGARRYQEEGRLVLEVRAGDIETDGVYVLEAGPEDARCRRAGAGEEAELGIGLADLGAAYLGGVSFRTLAATGRVEERAAGAIGRADALFRSEPAPWCGTDF